MSHSGGRFDFDDGGTYCGGWEGGKAHGQGICTGPKGQGEYAGSWNHGFEVLGVYTWPSGNTYEGNWSMGKRHNLGVETKGKWQYKGEWSHGLKGRYGVRSCITGRAKYEGTWNNGLQDGYGTETYADGGTYHGQWVGGMRQGWGVRQSMPFGMATIMRSSLRTSMTSLRSEHSNWTSPNSDIGSDAAVGSRGGFVLTKHSTTAPPSQLKKKRFFKGSTSSLRSSIMSGLKMRSKSNSSISSGTSRASVKSNKSYRSTMTTDTMGSNASEYSMYTTEADSSSQLAPIEDDIDMNTSESYCGEWKNDSRTGSGVCERTDGFMYEGGWEDNQRHGYGCTTFPDGTTEEGKYRNNVIILSARKKNLLPMKANKIKTKVQQAVAKARQAKETAKQKADIVVSRTSHSIAKSNQAEGVAVNARDEAKIARCVARDLAPDFHQPGIEYMRSKGEDPFKDMDNGDSLYMGETNDIASPESYHQFSDAKSGGLTVSPVPSRSGSVDANSMNIMESNILQKYSQNEKAKQNADNHKGQKALAKSLADVASKPEVAPKMQYLSPENAITITCSPPTPNEDSPRQSGAPSDNHIRIPRSESSEKVGRAPKHSFFKSLRIRPRKTVSVDVKDASELPSKIEGDTLKPTTPTAEEKRKKFMKSSTLPERSHNGGVDSFDYHNHRSEYLTGYEAEMAHESKSYVGSNSSFDQEYINPVASPTQQSEIFAFPDNTDTQHERTHTRGYSGSTTHSRGYSGSQGYQEIKIEHPQSPAQANSLSMSVLRPRDTENKYEEGPAPVVPAFANYAPPNDSIPATTPGKQKRHNTIYEESSYEEDFSSQDYLMGNNRSALPSVLRKRNNLENETKEEVQYQPIINESDSTKTYMVILVLLLNVGFLALFAQFLT